MNKRNWIVLGAVIALIVTVFVARSLLSHRDKADATKQQAHQQMPQASAYWTCPMHPQIHQDHPGECPICHMKLVKVEKKTEGSDQDQGEKRASLDVTESQLTLIGVQKTEVEKMTLKARIPVSGRILSSSHVAFQVYEKDLRYVRAGLSFRGEGNIYSEEEVSGTVSSVDTIVDPTSRTVRVEGTIKKGPKGLLSETSFRGEVELELDDRLAIPESAVLHTGAQDLVYIVGSDNHLTPKSVKLGMKTEGFYEVLSGLSEGDYISSGPNFLIDSEAKIRGAND